MPAAKKQKLEEKVAVDNSDAVFVPMCADFVHIGHIHILDGAASHGRVVVLLMTDEAMMSYKRSPRMTYEHRKKNPVELQADSLDPSVRRPTRLQH